MIVRQVGSGLEKTGLRHGQTGEIRGWTSANIYVVKGGVAIKYSPIQPPESFVYRDGFGPLAKRIIRARMEGDGEIYLESAEVGSAVAQPEGFPLKGEMVGMESLPH